MMEENQRYLYIACDACKGNLMVPNFVISFLKLFIEMNSFVFYWNNFPIFGALIRGASRTMIH